MVAPFSVKIVNCPLLHQPGDLLIMCHNVTIMPNLQHLLTKTASLCWLQLAISNSICRPSVCSIFFSNLNMWRILNMNHQGAARDVEHSFPSECYKDGQLDILIFRYDAIW